MRSMMFPDTNDSQTLWFISQKHLHFELIYLVWERLLELCLCRQYIWSRWEVKLFFFRHLTIPSGLIKSAGGLWAWLCVGALHSKHRKIREDAHVRCAKQSFQYHMTSDVDMQFFLENKCFYLNKKNVCACTFMHGCLKMCVMTGWFCSSSLKVTCLGWSRAGSADVLLPLL